MWPQKTLMNSFLFNLAYVSVGVAHPPWPFFFGAVAAVPGLMFSCPRCFPLACSCSRLILLSVLPVVQFCTQAFNTYARLTDADVIFSSTMRYLKFFRYFWAYNAFLFAILAVVLLSAIYFVRTRHMWAGALPLPLPLELPPHAVLC